MVQVVDQPPFASSQPQRAARSDSRSWLLPSLAIVTLGLSMLPPLLLVAGLLVLGPEAGVMFPGIYLVVLIVILVSGVLQTIAFVSWVTVIRRLFSNTVVAIVSVGIAFVVIDWVVFCVVAEALFRVVS